MKRIIIFSTNYLPHIGGAELAVKEVTDRLNEHDFTLITARINRAQPYFERIGNVDVYRIGVGYRLDVFLLIAFGWIKALHLHASNNFDLIWSLMASQGSIVAAFFEICTGKPLVLTLQEGNEEEHLKRYVGGNNLLYKIFIRPFHHLVFKRADHITVISRYLNHRAESVSPNTPMSIIPNGVDIKTFSYHFSREEIREVRLKYAQDDETLIVTTSRLVKKNAVDDLIQAMIFLPSSYRLLVLGEGLLRKDLEAQISHLGLEDRVFLQGAVEFTEIPKYLAASDVFCRPSLSEGMGNSFIEAMAAGLPVVATPVGGIIDFLEDEETGLLAEVSKPKSIAAQITRLTADEELRSRVIKNGRRMVQEEYGWDIISQKYKEVFTNPSK